MSIYTLIREQCRYGAVLGGLLTAYCWRTGEHQWAVFFYLCAVGLFYGVIKLGET